MFLSYCPESTTVAEDFIWVQVTTMDIHLTKPLADPGTPTGRAASYLDNNILYVRKLNKGGKCTLRAMGIFNCSVS